MANRKIAAVIAAVVLACVAGCSAGATTSGGSGPNGAPTTVSMPSEGGANGAPEPSYDSDCNGQPVCTEAQVDQQADGAAPPQSKVENGNYSYTVEEYLNYIVTDLDEVWTAWFLQNGYKEPMVGIQLVKPGDEPFTSQCTLNGKRMVVNDSFPNAFYCSFDSIVSAGVTYEGVVILPVTTFQKMWTGEVLAHQSKKVGDFAAAIITAHEFGHHVQDELKTQYAAKSGRVVDDPTGKNKELIADCLAGVWMTAAYYQGVLTDTDFEEAVSAIGAIGDGPGVTSDPHGTPEEREAALKLGYNGNGTYQPGSPGVCIAYYWR